MTEEETKKISIIFAALEAANVSVSDLSRLTRVSRTALHRWRKAEAGTCIDGLRLNLVYSTCLRLHRAQQGGSLPLKDTYKTAERIKVLRDIVGSTRLNN